MPDQVIEEDKRQKLYKELSTVYEMPDYSGWEKSLNDPEKVKKAYEFVLQRYDVTPDEFAKSLNLQSQTQQEPIPQNESFTKKLGENIQSPFSNFAKETNLPEPLKKVAEYLDLPFRGLTGAGISAGQNIGSAIQNVQKGNIGTAALETGLAAGEAGLGMLNVIPATAPMMSAFNVGGKAIEDVSPKTGQVVSNAMNPFSKTLELAEKNGEKFESWAKPAAGIADVVYQFMLFNVGHQTAKAIGAKISANIPLTAQEESIVNSSIKEGIKNPDLKSMYEENVGKIDRAKNELVEKRFAQIQESPQPIPILEKPLQVEVPSVMVDAKGNPIPMKSVREAQAPLTEEGKALFPLNQEIQTFTPTPELANLPKLDEATIQPVEAQVIPEEVSNGSQTAQSSPSGITPADKNVSAESIQENTVKPPISAKELNYQRQLAREERSAVETKQAKGLERKVENPIKKEDLTPDQIAEINDFIDEGGQNLKVLDQAGKPLSSVSLRKAFEEFKEDNGSEESRRAQALIEQYFEWKKSGVVEVRPYPTMPHEQIDADEFLMNKYNREGGTAGGSTEFPFGKGEKQGILISEQAKYPRQGEGKRSNVPLEKQIAGTMFEKKPDAVTEDIFSPESLAKGKTKSSGTLQSSIIPGGAEFMEQDVVPAVKSAISGMGSVGDALKKVFAPETRGESAKITASVMKIGLAEKARNEDIAYSALENAHTEFAKLPTEKNLQFIDAFETGQNIGDPKMNQAAKTMHTLWDERWKEMNKREMIDAYVENYFSHLFKDPEKAAEVLADMPKSLRGSRFFLKKRTAPTVKAAIVWAAQKGVKLELVSNNPVDVFMSSTRSMDKAIMADDVIKTLKKEGMMQFVKVGQVAPKGYKKINDSIGRVMQYSEAEKGLVYRGDYYMPEPAATIINNHLSPGIANTVGFKQIRQAGNFMNQVQLGLSAFHGGFTTNEALISNVALAVKEFSQGKIVEAGKTFIKSPIRPITNVIEGNKFFKDYLKNDPQTDKMLRAWIDGGMRRGLDKMYYNSSVQKFWDALHSTQKAAGEGNYPGALIRATGVALRTPGAIIEMTSRPLMQWLVPRQKTGAFLNGARDIVSDFESGKINAKARMSKLQDLQASIDNRFGQLVYDNLFWDKTLKDILMLSTRSVGWNFGTLRELGGGIVDAAKYPKQVLSGRGFEFTDRMAYTIALPAVVALEGAFATYMMTGKSPSELKDYFFPPTGKTNPDGTAERLSLPSYMKDVAAYTIQPSKTVAHKLHPMWGAMYQMMNNENYYGANISDADKASPQWMRDYASYIAQQFMPFSVTGFTQRQKAGESIGASAESFVGITPAPKYIVQTPAQEMMDKFLRARGNSKSTKESADKKQLRNTISKKIESGQSISDDVEKATQQGLITNGELDKSVIDRVVSTPHQRVFKPLKASEAVQVWNKMRSYEKVEVAEEMMSKLSNVADKVSEENLPKYQQIYAEAEKLATENADKEQARRDKVQEMIDKAHREIQAKK